MAQAAATGAGLADIAALDPADDPRAGIGMQQIAGTPAPYGRACTNCSKAKCKCIVRGDSGCERCHRLGKQCQASTPVRRRKAPPKAGSSRTAQLEEKLNDLVVLLKSQQERGQHPQPTPQPRVSQPSISLGTSTSVSNAPSEAGLHSVLTPISTPQSLASNGSEPSAAEAEECFRLFREEMLPYSPFLHFPPALTAAQLREERPFLWLAILSVSLRTFPRQTVAAEEVRVVLAQKLLMQHERSLDLLQGLLVYMTWCQYARREKPFIGIYAHLAISLVSDLGLNRAPSKGGCFSICWKTAKEGAPDAPPTPPTRDEARAVLACFNITSMLTTITGKVDTLRWTPYMDDFLREVTEDPESPLDSILAAQVKIHLVMEQVAQSEWQSTAPMSTTFAAVLRARLREIHASVPSQHKDRVSILGPLHFTELLVSEAAAAATCAPTGAAAAAAAPSGALDLDRIRNLGAAVEAIASFRDFFVRLTGHDYLAMSFELYAYLSFCMASLYGLSTLRDEPGWDRDAVRARVNVLDMVEHLVRTMGSVPRAAGMVLDGQTTDMYTRFATILMRVREKWAADMGDAGGADLAPAVEMSDVVPSVAALPTEGLDLDMSGMEMGIWNNDWFRDVFIPWDDTSLR